MSNQNAAHSGWLIPPTLPSAEVVPDRLQAEEFARLLFDGFEGWVNLRGVEEPAAGKPRVYEKWCAIDEALPAAVGDFVESCAANGFAAYLLPHPVRQNGGGKEDILGARAFAVDIDKGDISAKRAAIVAAVGEPWLTIRSGGTENGQSKLHLYFRLTSDALSVDFPELAAVRARVALRFGADTKVGQNPAQILRIPGSLHRKPGRPGALCALETVNPSSARPLAEFARVLGVAAANNSNVVPFSFDFNDAAQRNDMDRVLTKPILAEGKSEDGTTRFDGAGSAIGHWLRMMREGRASEAEARQAVRDWNAAIMVPPWDEARLMNDFDRLMGREVEARGPFMPPAAPAIPQTATGLKLTDWYAREKFIGAPPRRQWLVDGLIPRGTPGVFAAVGDAGKSMLALQLANVVASYPAPQTTAASPAGVSDTPRFFGQPIVGRGTAVFLTGEDDEAEVHRRLDAVDPSRAWRADGSRLIVLPLLSAGGARALIANGPRGPEFTPAWAEMKAQLVEIPDLALVVLDPLTLFVGGDTNDNAMGAALMGELNQLASRTGAAVMLIHHFAKAGTAKITGLSDARNAVLGAAAWTNNARWSLVLWEAGQDEAYGTLKALGRVSHARQAGVVYYGGLTKGNAPGAKVLRTMVRGAAGVLEDQTEALAAAAPQRGEVDEIMATELAALRAAQDRFSFTGSASALWEVFRPIIRKHDLPITKDGKGKGKHSVTDVFDRLCETGRLVRTSDTRGPARYEPTLS